MPAAAVIPAPIAYIKVVAVKKLVVGYLGGCALPLVVADLPHPSVKRVALVLHAAQIFYLEKIRVFQAGKAGIQKHGIMELASLCGCAEKRNG